MLLERCPTWTGSTARCTPFSSTTRDRSASPTRCSGFWPADEVIWAYLAEMPRMMAGSDSFLVFTHIDYAVRYWPVTVKAGPFDPPHIRRWLPYRHESYRGYRPSPGDEHAAAVVLDPAVVEQRKVERPCTFGSDAHTSASISPTNFPEATAMVEYFGFRPGSTPRRLLDPVKAGSFRSRSARNTAAMVVKNDAQPVRSGSPALRWSAASLLGGVASVMAGTNTWANAWTADATLAAPWPMLAGSDRSDSRSDFAATLGGKAGSAVLGLDSRRGRNFRLLRRPARPGRPQHLAGGGPGRRTLSSRAANGCGRGTAFLVKLRSARSEVVVEARETSTPQRASHPGRPPTTGWAARSRPRRSPRPAAGPDSAPPRTGGHARSTTPTRRDRADTPGTRRARRRRSGCRRAPTKDRRTCRTDPETRAAGPRESGRWPRGRRGSPNPAAYAQVTTAAARAVFRSPRQARANAHAGVLTCSTGAGSVLAALPIRRPAYSAARNNTMALRPCRPPTPGIS